MYIIKKDKGFLMSIPAKELEAEKIKHLNSELALKILELLTDKELYPKQIAEQLKLNEQKVYYHIRNLEKAGFLVQTKKERIKGSEARYYKLAKKGFFIKFGDFEKTPKLLGNASETRFLRPFIDNGKLNALIVVGSPDPHGIEKARSRDGYYGIDLGLFIGTFLSYVPKPNVKLDTEIREEELKNNIILIGGPIVNKVAEKFNRHLPVRFERHDAMLIKSTITGNTYPEDEMGVIVKQPNPFNRKASVLVIAGKRYTGTRAAIIAILKHFDEVANGNKYKRELMARVVEGFDLDSDGIVDEVEFRE